MEKIMTPVCREAVERIESKEYYRIVVFGASNTDRYMPVVHWSDVLETGLYVRYNKKFHMINSGISGNNTRDALQRFDRDVASFAPDIVIITLAGNDCIPDPARHVPPEEFAANLERIVAKVRALNAIPILQTYYKVNYADVEPVRGKLFIQYMDIIRETAAKNQVFLVDQYKYFDALPNDIFLYKLMLNSFHVNEYGNMFIGVNLLHHFGIDPLILNHNEKVLPAIKLYNSIAE